MKGSYGLILVLFGLIVDAARVTHLGFLDLPLEWMLAVHLALVFGVAWAVVGALVRILVRTARTDLHL